MNSSLKICILGCLFCLTVNSFAQINKTTTSKKTLETIKANKRATDFKNAKKIADVDKAIKDAERTGIEKSSSSKKSNAKKKVTVEKKVEEINSAKETTGGQVLTGIASFYSAKFEGRQTANGEIFSHSKLTCACNRLPLGTWLKITNLKNNKTIIVKVNDRMAPHMKRLVDLTLTGAKKLDFVAAGLTQVKAEVIKKK